jgi:hypothetical protein
LKIGVRAIRVSVPSAFIAFRRDKLHDIFRVQKPGKNLGGYFSKPGKRSLATESVFVLRLRRINLPFTFIRAKYVPDGT